MKLSRKTLVVEAALVVSGLLVVCYVVLMLLGCAVGDGRGLSGSIDGGAEQGEGLGGLFGVYLPILDGCRAPVGAVEGP